MEFIGDLLVSLMTEGLGALATGSLNRWLRERQVDAFFRGLQPAEQRAFLELVAAAAFDDGKLSRAEKKLLFGHVEAADAQLVDEALAAVTEALPFATPHAREAFLQARGAALTTSAQRELAFGTAAFVLLESKAADAELTIESYRTALGLTKERTEELRARWLSNYTAIAP